MARLTIQLLGSFRASLGKTTLSARFRTEKERALFAYLAAEKGRAFSRDALAELFWPERPPGAGRTNLRQALSGLRRALMESHTEQEFLLADDESIRFNPAADAWYDVEALESHLHFTAEHKHGELEDCPECIQRLELAVELYHGEFLDGLTLSDSPGFQEWVLFRREQYFAQFLSALQTLGNYYLAHGDFEQAHQIALRQVNLAPLEESGHRRLMTVLAAGNRRAAALEQYQNLRRLLHDELGVEPAPETRQLYELIRSGAPIIAGPKPPTGPLKTCILPLTTFVDRTAELAYLERCFNNPVCRLVALIGLPGVGKSRLALEAARRFGDYFEDGVYCLALDAEPEPASLPVVLALALGLNPEDESAARQQLFETLKTRKVLLVLDQMEPLLGQAPFLVELVQRASGVKILLPTHHRLHLQAASYVQIEGLSCPRDSADPAAADSPAVQLFLARAERSRPGLEYSPANLRDIAALCRKVEGHPLALELAAQALRAWSPAEIVRRCESDLAVFQSRLQDVPPRQRSLEACFTPAWQRLEPELQEILGRLAVLPGDFGRDLARSLAGAGEDTLATLASRSFLRLSNEATGRYSLHPLVRRFILDRLAGQPEALELAHHRFSAALLFALAEALKNLCSPNEICCARRGCGADHLQIILDWIATEAPNLGAAFNWAVDHHQAPVPETALQSLQQTFRGVGACACCTPCLEGLRGALFELDLTPRARLVVEEYCPGNGWCCDRVGVIADAIDAMVLVSDEGRILEANYASSQLTGFPRLKLLEKSLADLIVAEVAGADSPPAPDGQVRGVLMHANGALMPVAIKRRTWPEGHDLYNLVILKPWVSPVDGSGAVPGFDPLTGLPNRALFFDRLRHALTLTEREGREMAVILLDLQEMGKMNARYGYAAGDELLHAVGRRLAACLRKSDTLARLGADEFGVLLETVTGKAGVRVVLGKLERQFVEPFDLEVGDVAVRAQMGVCCYPGCAEDVEDLVRQADLALKKARSSAAGSYLFHCELEETA